MADWHDVLEARRQSDAAMVALIPDDFPAEIGAPGDTATAVLYAAMAVRLELRALSTMVHYAAKEIADAVRFAR